MKRATKALFSALKLGVILFIISSCENESPVIEFFQPYNNSTFITDTTIYFEVIVYDNDGLIKDWERYIDDVQEAKSWNPPGEPLKSEYYLDYSIELSSKDTGDHSMTIRATDNRNATSEKTIQWYVQDFRAPFIGDWFFYTERRRWNYMNTGITLYDTLEFEGNIAYRINDHENGDHEIIANYYDSDSVVIEINRSGTIAGIEGFDPRNSAALYFDEDSICLFLMTAGLGMGTELKLKGKKQSERWQQVLRSRKTN